MTTCFTANSRLRCAFVAACLASLGACQTAPSGSSNARTMEANGARFTYVDEGRGVPVVFVHGAVSDYRTWDRQRTALAGRNYRAISYTQRHFGTGPWAQNGPAFGVRTHTDDLAAFIRGLGAGPVHLVAWSYSGQVALQLAFEQPALVKSAFVFETAHQTFITDPAQQKAIDDDTGPIFSTSVQAVKAGDNAAAVRELIDGVANRKGFFDEQPALVKAVQLDSAAMMPLMYGAAKPPALTCTQLAEIKPPVALVRGEAARPYFAVTTDAAARCMPQARHVVVPGQGHMWPGEDVAGFTSALVGFLGSR